MTSPVNMGSDGQKPWAVTQADLDAVQAMMVLSSYNIWPADARQNIAELVAQTRHEAQAELVEALRNLRLASVAFVTGYPPTILTEAWEATDALLAKLDQPS